MMLMINKDKKVQKAVYLKKESNLTPKVGQLLTVQMGHAAKTTRTQVLLPEDIDLQNFHVT